MLKIYQKEWHEGDILRIYQYKGKGKKGKCSNERSITLSSNLGKLYERILNARIKKKITITHAQARGRKGTTIMDHKINTLKELITCQGHQT